MRTANLLSLVLVASCFNFAAADESDSETIKQLTKRIEQLEKRLAQVESKPTSNQSYGIANPPGTYIGPPVYGPANPDNLRLGKSEIFEPKSDAPTEQVPDSWQKFKFNGSWFYIIPIDQASSYKASSTTCPTYDFAIPRINFPKQITFRTVGEP